MVQKRWEVIHSLGSKKKTHPKIKKITLLQQSIALRTAYPDGMCNIEKHNRLFWGGKICPTPLSQQYNVLLSYELGGIPHVWVIGDELQKLDDPEFPHKFEIDKKNKMVRLCLYRYQEFNQHKYLSRTIIPWTVEWLYFYEIWLATGKWCGGGDHPQLGEQKIDDVV